uniref:Probable pectate lyase F n=1 Tax=Radopholus similis TaxID=46012 RepID=A0A6C0VTZ6_RADSI|nr:pectate lyase 5 [Radopholus similis]
MYSLFVLSLVLLSAVPLANAANSICSIPSATGSVSVSKMMVLSSGVTDFGNKRYTASYAKDCSVNGAANIDHIMSVADGGTVQNLILANPGKGIWCQGSCTLKNVYFEKVCYHAAGFAPSTSSKTVLVSGGAALNAPDKIFTAGNKGTTTIDGFCGDSFTSAILSCGDKANCGSVQRNIVIKNSKFRGKGLGSGQGLQLVSLNPSMKDTLSLSNVQLYGYKTSSTTLSYACREWDLNSAKTIASTASKPTENGKGTSCNYKASSITIVN